jgi:hypothetical protein
MSELPADGDQSFGDSFVSFLIGAGLPECSATAANFIYRSIRSLCEVLNGGFLGG